MLVYLASPYTDPSRQVRKKRAKAVIAVAVRLIQQYAASGVRIYSPIAHTHAMAEAGDLPCNFDYWEEFDRRVLTVCDELWIAKLDGWQESHGISNEVQIMRQLHKPIRYVDPESLVMEIDY